MNKQIEILANASKYILVNKPSGIQSNGFNKNCILPQLTKHLKDLNPSKRLESSRLKLVQRLDKYVTGGLIISKNDNFTKKLNKCLREETSATFSLTRRYVGLLKSSDLKNHLKQIPFKLEDELDSNNTLYKGLVFKDDSMTEGVITYDISLMKNNKQILQNSITKFKILHELKRKPNASLKQKYPYLFNSNIYPIIIELKTGRKNQIRDHILQAFGIPLLNDDKFLDFKLKLPQSNSENFKSNQIGLHCAFLKLRESSNMLSKYLMPIHDDDDQELWQDFIDKKGNFIPEIKSNLISW